MRDQYDIKKMLYLISGVSVLQSLLSYDLLQPVDQRMAQLFGVKYTGTCQDTLRLFGNVFSMGGSNLTQSLESSSNFSGDADNTQNNEFSGSISVVVTEVLPNGYLRVRGEKRIGMTAGNEYIRVSGIVRPEDIDLRNTVESTRVADATLVYVGDGQTSMASRMGWLARFFASALMPF